MTLSYRAALREGLREALAADDRVFLMGEDVGRYGGSFAVSMGLLEEFGPERIRDTPLSESGFVGAGIGAALGGMRPIVEIMTVNFSLLALDQILNNAATILHMSGGQFAVPLVIRTTTGAGRQLAAQHSHSLEGWYAHIPGLRVVCPATVADARAMLGAALDDPDPVMIFEHAALFDLSDELPDPPEAVDLDHATIRRPGTDLTIVSHGACLQRSLHAAEQLAATGISAEVIDLRTLRPLDTPTVVASVTRTHRALVVEEAWRTGGIGAEVAARIAELAFWDLDAPVGRLGGVEVPVPYARHLEAAAIPQVDDIVAAAARAGGVMGEFTMPTLGADMDQGTLLEWRVAVGDHVERGDIMAVVDTEKSTIEIEVFESGVVAELLVEPGTEVPVGTPLARIRSDDGAPAATPPAATPPAATPPAAPTITPPTAPPTPVATAVAAVPPTAASGPGWAPAAAPSRRSRPRSSPLARRRAREQGIDLASLVGTGPGGSVRARDVRRAAAPPAAPAAPAPAAAPAPPSTASALGAGGGDRRRPVRRAIARLMTTANRDIPHYHVVETVDLHEATAWLAARNDGRPPAERVLMAAVLLRATALAADAHRELNGTWVDDDVRPADGVHLGVAISQRGGGLIVPTIRDAQLRTLDETMAELRDLVTRVRQGSLKGSQTTAASITVTNLGDRGAEAVYGVIHPPQIALVGFGRIVDRPVAVEGLVGVHPTVTATLSGDHRATDGHAGSLLLETLHDLLQRPAEL